MSKISNKVKYPVKSPVVSDDYLIGTDSTNTLTKNFTVGDILSLFTANNIASLPTATTRDQEDYLQISQSGTATFIRFKISSEVDNLLQCLR